MQTRRADVAIVGGGGAGLRAAMAAIEAHPQLDVVLVSKVYPMRSHTVAAEGGAAGVVGEDDSLERHFADTVSGGDWLCDQDVVQYFVEHATDEMYQLERWGCPWSRRDDGRVDVRRFGGMSQPRTWFAADKTGFHMLHTLFQTSLKYPAIQRLDEHLALDLVVQDGQVAGVVTYDQRNGYPVFVEASAVVLATGGAGRMYAQNTNGAIVTGDGMAMAYRAGVPLRDMEFVQYHPTGLPGSGILITEGCRGEGGVLFNKDGYRYLQDYGLGPETPLGQPTNKYMELGPRDRLSQAFWHEQQAGRTVPTLRGDAVHLDLRHLGRSRLHERLPLICELAERLQRYRPDRPDAPYLQEYEVPWDQDTSVLDALTWIKDNLDATLTFRWSCRMAICGSCGLMLNGEPKLGCEHFVRDYAPGPLRVQPLANFDVERDLVVDLEPFLSKLAAVRPYLVPGDEPLPEAGNRQTPEQLLAYRDFAMCINCLLCYAACPQVGLATDFLGPAAVTAAVRYDNDSRDHGADLRLPALDSETGLWPCTFVGACSTACPKGVDPAAAVQQAKLASAMAWAVEFVTPHRGADQ